MRASSPTFATATPALSWMIDSISSSTRTVPCSETALNPWKVSARRTRLDNEAAAIAGLGSLRPVVIVQHSTMRVIDGVHRLCAAELRGGKYFKTKFSTAMTLTRSSLPLKRISPTGPLTLEDRRAAAARVIASHQQWSDRMIASVTGLAARTVAEVRRKTRWAAELEQFRIGQDGRVRPINSTAGRELAAKLMTENPGSSLRQIARASGISPKTGGVQLRNCGR